jgi:hypothetical protein
LIDWLILVRLRRKRGLDETYHDPLIALQQNKTACMSSLRTCRNIYVALSRGLWSLTLSKDGMKFELLLEKIDTSVDRLSQSLSLPYDALQWHKEEW